MNDWSEDKRAVEEKLHDHGRRLGKLEEGYPTDQKLIVQTLQDLSKRQRVADDKTAEVLRDVGLLLNFREQAKTQMDSMCEDIKGVYTEIVKLRTNGTGHGTDKTTVRGLLLNWKGMIALSAGLVGVLGTLLAILFYVLKNLVKL